MKAVLRTYLSPLMSKAMKCLSRSFVLFQKLFSTVQDAELFVLCWELLNDLLAQSRTISSGKNV
jgi:hypothetical protein